MTTNNQQQTQNSEELITIGHKHELMDRASAMGDIFQALIVDHPAAKLLQAEIDDIGERLGNLYQLAGRLYLEHKE